MRTAEILQFLTQLRDNNSREWFASQKDYCKELQKDFEKLTQDVIEEISAFDPEIKGLDAKNCIFRLYRDTRFSPDKTPYKSHFGAYMASKGGRKSPRAGYYLHLEPGNSFISGGIYMPDAVVLKALRQAIYENIDEWLEITGKPFASVFPDMYGEDDKLKKVPLGFPKDWEQGELLKYKHYAFGRNIPDEFYSQTEIVPQLIEFYKYLQPVNRFLNFTVDEVLNLG
ncbi:DUF2461 domain-containing protein [Paludibacter jiangxiensis]|uniref:TIGR02453 family protein n=1 Tax=Paludibacter jiangxiensis TaxID=681398 RepID=A0A161LTX8_9BACT|nr:DUF2461 domain-containing protein [Paludibacter jiangxiensis]GAT61439.1 TIGR02453 family protein [Paludibacter jiangxiensis]